MMENLTNEETVADDVIAGEQANAVDTAEVNEEIVLQRIMDYKAYRRGMIMTRMLITLAATVALAFLIRFNIVLGLLLPVAAVIIGAISILVSMGNERTYTIYNTRVVIKRRGEDTRKSVPLESIESVTYKSAFYEKRMCIGTVTIKAKNAKGKLKNYKLKHIFDAQPVVDYLTGVIGRNTNADEGRE
ncbi:MAG: hypothetical protein K2L88_02595 [Clostridiales bacterium]|nr:hypothetical protein [Clostridiales bacterium]